ncbi:MAG TPA: type II secretion system protein GspD [Oceanicaulis sp.]|jgi:general secretion pathway protein D|uniref:Type II secretion system protein GspD n=1 Tax=Glycocaulis albus TaxID=1382801 RepID=A0ABQ1XV19_9PROT|nr:type II secretion system secretin GspD [Glycocaulis albus]GGH03974.1 type II secretion system protein GspD [Glycocaulis albus]HCY54524.1 type II secretion system protein GspD [Oceanicaulis sp.]
MIVRIAAILASLILLSGVCAAQESERTTLNFRNADMTAFIEDMAALTGYTFVVDPQIRGVVTITSQGPVTREEAFQVFLATLRVHGFSAVPTAPGVYQIRAEREGARSGAPLGADDGLFSTSVVRLQSASAREAVRTLASMVSAVGTIMALESGNSVVIVDYASNIAAIEQALRALDRDNTVIEMVELQNVSADEMARIIERLRQPAFQGEDNRRYAFNIAPVPASNTLLIRGEASAVRDIIALARRVDAVSRSNQSFRVIALSHADGAALLPILEQVSVSLTPADSEGSTARRASIAHHAPTNTIVVNADPDQLRELELVIRQLDVRRPQVLVEAIIVEISDQAARDLGLQLLLSGNEGSATPFLATRYGASPDILAVTGGLTARGDDEASETLREAAIQSLLRSSGALIGVGGQNSNGAIFGAILNALEADTGSNILSKPSILTLDNEEASIIVGQQIPITTGEVLGANNSNPFRTIERQDVGVQLRVQPQISDGDTIRLHLRQEVSSVAGPVSQTFAELVTNNRAIETTVLADNGEIIVLGGLIERDEQISDSGVPGLRRIPVLGRAFRNEARSDRRTNLVVFIRPVIVRNAADMRALALDAYATASAEQRRATDGRGSSLEDLVHMMMDAPPAESGGQ